MADLWPTQSILHQTCRALARQLQAAPGMRLPIDQLAWQLQLIEGAPPFDVKMLHPPVFTVSHLSGCAIAQLHPIQLEMALGSRLARDAAARDSALPEAIRTAWPNADPASQALLRSAACLLAASDDFTADTLHLPEAWLTLMQQNPAYFLIYCPSATQRVVQLRPVNLLAGLEPSIQIKPAAWASAVMAATARLALPDTAAMQAVFSTAAEAVWSEAGPHHAMLRQVAELLAMADDFTLPGNVLAARLVGTPPQGGLISEQAAFFQVLPPHEGSQRQIRLLPEPLLTEGRRLHRAALVAARSSQQPAAAPPSAFAIAPGTGQRAASHSPLAVQQAACAVWPLSEPYAEVLQQAAAALAQAPGCHMFLAQLGQRVKRPAGSPTWWDLLHGHPRYFHDVDTAAGSVRLRLPVLMSEGNRLIALRQAKQPCPPAPVAAAPVAAAASADASSALLPSRPVLLPPRQVSLQVSALSVQQAAAAVWPPSEPYAQQLQQAATALSLAPQHQLFIAALGQQVPRPAGCPTWRALIDDHSPFLQFVPSVGSGNVRLSLDALMNEGRRLLQVSSPAAGSSRGPWADAAAALVAEDWPALPRSSQAKAPAPLGWTPASTPHSPASEAVQRGTFLSSSLCAAALARSLPEPGRMPSSRSLSEPAPRHALILPPLHTQLITTAAGTAAVQRHLAACSRVGVATQWAADDMCLLQVAAPAVQLPAGTWPAMVYVVDVMVAAAAGHCDAVMAAIAPMLEDPGTLKVFHDCRKVG